MVALRVKRSVGADSVHVAMEPHWTDLVYMGGDCTFAVPRWRRRINHGKGLSRRANDAPGPTCYNYDSAAAQNVHSETAGSFGASAMNPATPYFCSPFFTPVCGPTRSRRRGVVGPENFLQ